ncbi:MAG: hypothetical protein E6G97_23610 [Alphaproteobacteria bacterium]|nr:MAG: hypothetical protein E6G97_23610 [Alphaproteobacteria bacterium]
MIAMCRNLCAALGLVAALGSAQAQDARVTLAMTPAPLGGASIAPLTRPALLCGNRWVQGDYVKPANCQKACTNLGHPQLLCQLTLVTLCQSCWKQLVDCASKPAPGAGGVKCVACSAFYADCMKPFLLK